MEKISTFEARRRFLSEDLLSDEDIPYYPRSTVDGFAVRSADTVGASLQSPVLLKLIGEVPMAKKPDFKIEPGTCCRIWTGGWIPEGADGVVMLENASVVGDFVEIYRPCGAGENVIKVGDDVRRGEVVIEKGREIRPQELALLQALGVLELSVFRRPRVLIIPTGNELVEPWVSPIDGKIRETNSASIYVLIKEYCEVVGRHQIVKDDKKLLFEVLMDNLPKYDLILITGGSSKGSGDFTLKAIEDFEDSEILYHGVHISPGKPTIFGRIKEKPIIGLPGHPVSSFVSAYLFVLPLIKYLQGAKDYLPEPCGYLRAGMDIPSKPGREEWVRVFKDGDKAIPVFSESGIMSSLTKATGLVRIPENVEGISKGEEVEYYPL